MISARGLRSQQRAVRAAIEVSERGTTRIRIGARAVVAWTVANPALAQLMFWRPVPGFEPSPEVFHDSVTEMVEVQAELAEAVQRGELVARAAEADAVRLFTIVLSGVISQQMADEPGATYDTGVFTRLTDDAIDMYFQPLHTGWSGPCRPWTVMRSPCTSTRIPTWSMTSSRT
jgi:hypothetical protein